MKHTIRKGVRADGTVEGHYVETYYTPCKGIATENDGLYLRVVADNGATDIETRVLFSTLESDGWINPNESNNIRAQLAEEKYVTKRLSETLAEISILVGYIPERNDPAQIDKVVEKLRAQLAEARKDSERLNHVMEYIAENSGFHNMTGNPEENGAYLTYWGTGFAYENRESIDNAMKGGE